MHIEAPYTSLVSKDDINSWMCAYNGLFNNLISDHIKVEVAAFIFKGEIQCEMDLVY